MCDSTCNSLHSSTSYHSATLTVMFVNVSNEVLYLSQNRIQDTVFLSFETENQIVLWTSAL